MSKTKPNIVIIQTDSHDGRLLGCMGHPALRHATPNIDRLASQGVTFENTYCNYPLCCPSRASMWSGRFAHNIGAWNNYRGISPNDATFATALETAGYQIGVFGKTDYLSENHSGTARLAAWSRAASIPRPVHGEKKPPTVLSENKIRVRGNDWRTVDKGVNWINEAATDQKPFLLYLGITSPHHSFGASRHYLERIPTDALTLPAEDSLDHPLLALQRLQKNWNHALDEEGMLLRRRIYFAMIAEIDTMVGEVLETLAGNGLNDNTWIIFTSDHGEMAGEHGQYIKLTHFEASSRIPLIVRGPGVPAGERIRTPASLIDLHPTLLDLGGAPLPANLDGHSLVPELTGGIKSRPARVFAEHHSTTCPTGAFMLRRDQWKYIAYPGYPSLLFNLDDDPDELHDLCAGQPEMVQVLDAELREIVDYEAIDAQAKAEDRECFAAWREETLREGTYAAQMAAVYSGAGHPPLPVQPWREEDEQRIRQWLAGNPPQVPALTEEFVIKRR